LWDKIKDKLFMELFTTKCIYSFRRFMCFIYEYTTVINPL
jgi:hypothetical protein